MKRVLCTLIGITLLVAPLQTKAQVESRPFSTQYLGPVFTRMQEEIAAAQNGAVYTDTQFVFLEHLSRIVAALLEFTNTRTQVTENERNLATTVPCLHHDLLVFEERIADLRFYLRAALRERRLFDVRRLQALSRWTNERYRHFVAGALNPEIVDKGYKTAQGGDACAFDMRYLPPSKSGYGCTVSQMQSIVDPHETIQQEIVATSALMQELEDQQGGGGGGGVEEQPSGCLALEDWPDGAIIVARRGHFSVDPDDVGLVQELDTFLRSRGKNREPPDYMKLPQDYPPEERQEAQNREQRVGYIQGMIRYFIRLYYSVWNPEHSVDDARIITQSIQKTAGIDSTTEPLRKNMKEFAELVGDSDKGMRLFNTKFAFYLMRSCPFRPCKKHLTRIMRINFTDACFPYADGSFANDPFHHITCKESASVFEEL